MAKEYGNPTAKLDDIAEAVRAELRSARRRQATWALKQRVEIERSLDAGDVPLWYGLLMWLDTIPGAEKLRHRLLRAYGEYQNVKCKDLAQPLGVALSGTKKERIPLDARDAYIKARVDQVAAGEELPFYGDLGDGRGVRLLGKATYPKRIKDKGSRAIAPTAYEVVGKEMGLSPDRIASIHSPPAKPRRRRAKKI